MFSLRVRPIVAVFIPGTEPLLVRPADRSGWSQVGRDGRSAELLRLLWPPVTDGPFVETKDLIAGWYIIDVESWDRAVQLAGELSAAPGPGGKPICEWLEVRPFLAEAQTISE